MTKYTGYDSSLEGAIQNAIGQAIQVKKANNEEIRINYEITRIEGNYSYSNEGGINKGFDVEIMIKK